ncbi:uncharacterized protein LOC124949222 isoform X2 [Vespa velutina]|uniref:uncharacterized protein LOC124949222 isoform X2 n=1 Tax=Vespa velutina TaxID=202808 RepID=UPI001FB2F1DB|nr:uncharacterized protein LOC124949222 isoform X2 [Vespa velutina]
MSSRIYIVLFVIIILFGNNVVIGLNVTTQDYLLLITKVYDTYESSSVFFVDSGRTNNLQISTMLHAWSREISRQGIFSISINFSELKKMKYYQISRPLFVIIISTWENLEEFSKVTKEIDVSLYIWFVLFVETANNTLEKFCKNPIGNIFNLNFDTEMLILCYDEMILKEWYSIQGNNTITSNFAIWKPGKDFSVITKMSLYNRRSDLFGTVLRVGWVKTFSFGIWAMLILVITTTPILLTLIKTKGSFSGSLLSENYIHVWGIYCQQGLAEFPTEPSLRLAFISIFVSAIIVSAAYSASLISFLTVTTESLPFSSLDDFANARTYHLIVFGNSADYDMFANAKDEVIMKMMELMKPKKQLPTSLHNGFDQVCREKVAFYTTEEMKKTINLYLSCKINYIETGRSDSLAMTLPKGSPFKGLINYHLQKFIDNGIMNRLRGSFIIQPSLSRTSHSAVSLWDVTPILAVLSGGTILGIIILIIERTYHHYKMKRKFSRSNLKILQNGLNVPKYSNVNRIDKNYILEKLNRAHKINDFKSSINYFP